MDHLGRAAGNGHRVLESLFDRPTVSVSDMRNVINTTYAAANNLVARLADLGILLEVTGCARNRRSRYGPYVRLALDEEVEGGTRGPSLSPTLGTPRRSPRSVRWTSELRRALDLRAGIVYALE